MNAAMLSGLPEALQSGVLNRYGSYVQTGVKPDAAFSMALRDVHNAGFYRTARGWEQLGPDIRSRVNVRHAEQQPDGRYIVRGVDVFYPNAVKGGTEETAFDSDKIFSAIQNTNRAIMSGGQKPALAVEHPNPMKKIGGHADKAFGSCINWRASNRGPGWVQCDIVDIDPSIIEDWKSRRYTGLSAGFVADADGLNLRFGHVALLGVEAQALSALPTVEVFAASKHLFFSADAAAFNSQGKKPMTRKELFAALKSHFSALQAAYAAAETEEPQFQAKIGEARKNFSQFCNENRGAFGEHPDAAQDVGLIQSMLGETPPAGAGGMGGPAPTGNVPPAANHSMTGAAPTPPFSAGGGATKDGHTQNEQTLLPEEPELKTPSELPATLKVPPAGQHFAAEAKAALDNANQMIARLMADRRKTQFEKTVRDLLDAGHKFSADEAMKQFSACKGDDNAVAVLVGALKMIPKTADLAEVSKAGATFGAEGGKPSPKSSGEVTDAEVQETLKALRKFGSHLNFSAQDVKTGIAISR